MLIFYQRCHLLIEVIFQKITLKPCFSFDKSNNNCSLLSIYYVPDTLWAFTPLDSHFHDDTLRRYPQFTAEKAKTGNMACPRSQVLLTLMPADSSGRGSSDWAFPCPQRPAQVPAQGGRCLFRVVWMGQPVYRLLQAGTRSRLLHPLFPSLWS